MLFWDWTMIILVPAILLGLWAQANISRTYARYSSVSTYAGMTAAQVARDILDQNGLHEVRIEMAAGNGLSDHYDPRTNVLRLSHEVFSSTSVAALGIAAHEAGHAIQKNTGYALLRLRSAIVPLANIGSYAAWPLLFLGLLFGSYNMALLGVGVFGLAVVFQLITLPVEFNASSRAMAALAQGGYLQYEEQDGARRVLNAAAMTYVAATLMSILQMLRLLVFANSTRRRG